jgi:transcriptional regulator with XRE-family HTH domain
MVGKRIRELRLQRGLTQEEAARLSGFDYKYYQRIEYGEKNLALTSLQRLAKALGVPAWHLLKVERD